jgi:hypothetical protein
LKSVQLSSIVRPIIGAFRTNRLPSGDWLTGDF